MMHENNNPLLLKEKQSYIKEKDIAFAVRCSKVL
jgi:hypothetical protein